MEMITERGIYVSKIVDLEFFQGDTVTIPFEFFDGNNDPIDLRRVDVYWYLCPYGRYNVPSLILSDKVKDSQGVSEIVINEAQPNLCYVHLSYEQTQKLNFIKYTHQPVIILKNSNGTRRYIRAEGNIIFKPYIKDKGEFTNRGYRNGDF